MESGLFSSHMIGVLYPILLSHNLTSSYPGHIWCLSVAHGVSSQGKPFPQICLPTGTKDSFGGHVSASGPRHLIVWVQSKLKEALKEVKWEKPALARASGIQEKRVWLQSEDVRLICPYNLGCACLISRCPLPCSEARIPSLWMASVIVPIGEEGRHMVGGWGHDLGIQRAQNKRPWFIPVGYKLSSEREANYIMLIMAVVWFTLPGSRG